MIKLMNVIVMLFAEIFSRLNVIKSCGVLVDISFMMLFIVVFDVHGTHLAAILSLHLNNSGTIALFDINLRLRSYNSTIKLVKALYEEKSELTKSYRYINRTVGDLYLFKLCPP